MFKDLYVRAVQGSRSVMERAGLLAQLDRRVDSRGWHWLRSQWAVYNIEDLVQLDTPWWTYKATESVEAWLANRSNVRAFEWGSGASTIWLQQRVESVTSAEHDAPFVEIVTPFLAENSTLLPHPGVATDQPAIPSKKPGFEGLDFTNYVQSINEVEGDFDLIVIDGRARAACLVQAVPRLREGGLIVFDNSQRKRYRSSIERSGLQVQRFRGLTPAAPFPTETALLSK